MVEIMEKKIISLTNLSSNKKARIAKLDGGQGFQKKLRSMGIREGQIIKIVSKQPFRGPFTVSVGNCNITLGRGMADKILIEAI
jgi:ferrous iron transport protein A